MASGTQVRRLLLELTGDDADASEKIASIKAKADELKESFPELVARINTAEANAKLKVLRDELSRAGTGVPPIVPKVDDVPAIAGIDELKVKLDEVAARARDIPVSADDSAANAKILGLRAKLAELGDKVTSPKIDLTGVARARADIASLEAQMDAMEPKALDAGTKAGRSFGLGFLKTFKGQAITAGVMTALAALPAVAGGVGALAGGLLAAKLLVGSSLVKGPLYAQWTDMSRGLMSVLRTSTLPLLEPLKQVFSQITSWAQQLKPELSAVFGSLGPLMMPLTKGLEGVVNGLLPGFLALMRASGPAVAGLSGLLGSLSQSLGGLLGGMAPAVRASGVVLGALGLLIRGLMPVVTSLTRSLSGALGPALGAIARVVTILAPPLSRLSGALVQLGGSVLTTVVRAVAQLLPPLAHLTSQLVSGLMPILPPLERYFTSVAGSLTSQVTRAILGAMPGLTQLIGGLLRLANGVIIPLLPQLTTLTEDMVGLQVNGVTGNIGPVVTLANTLVKLANDALIPLMPLIQQATGLLVSMMNVAVQAANAVNSVLSLFGLGGGGISAAQGLGGWTDPAAGGLSIPGLPTPAQGYSAGAAVGGAWGDGVLAGTVKAASKTAAAAKKTPADLALILASGTQADLTGTAAQVRAAVARLVGAVTTDEGAGVISQSKGSALSMWLEADSSKLQSLATKRASILSTIAAAQKYASGIASSIRSSDDLTSASAGGWNGGPQTNGQIVANLQMDVQQINKFSQNIKKLGQMGLNKTYLSQLIAMGPQAGGQLAQQLAGSGLGEIHQINAAESSIVSSSAYLAKTAANEMYDTGVNAGHGFLSGLESQQAALENMMKKLAASMVNTIKKELGIHSPSTVGREVGRNFADSHGLGMLDGLGGIETKARQLGRAMSSGASSVMGGGYGSGGGGGVPKIQVEFVGNANDPLWALFKRNIRVTGGNVLVLGR